MKQELETAKTKAELSSQAKAQFLSAMSHEIRTPMSTIIGMTHLMLQDNNMKPEHIENLNILKFSSEGLLALINDILDFSKIEAGKMDLEHQPFDLRECVESALDLVAGRAVEKNHCAVAPELLGFALPQRLVSAELRGAGPYSGRTHCAQVQRGAVGSVVLSQRPGRGPCPPRLVAVRGGPHGRLQAQSNQ